MFNCTMLTITKYSTVLQFDVELFNVSEFTYIIFIMYNAYLSEYPTVLQFDVGVTTLDKS